MNTHKRIQRIGDNNQRCDAFLSSCIYKNNEMDVINICNYFIITDLTRFNITKVKNDAG